jgi:hypothetical protein
MGITKQSAVIKSQSAMSSTPSLLFGLRLLQQRQQTHLRYRDSDQYLTSYQSIPSWD